MAVAMARVRAAARHASRRRRVGLFMVYLLWWGFGQRGLVMGPPGGRGSPIE
jgi:hypothetical protein